MWRDKYLAEVKEQNLNLGGKFASFPARLVGKKNTKMKKANNLQIRTDYN